jgi:hypothetical protein
MTVRGAPMAWLRARVGYSGDDCLEWPFGTNQGGYSNVRYDGRSAGAYRVMCEMAHGNAPFPRAEAAHSCGNRGCVNPKHLRWATRAENHADMKSHGTSITGSRNGWAKLKEDDVLRIKRRLQLGETAVSVAKDFNVSQYAIYDIKQGRRWGWLEAA